MQVAELFQRRPLLVWALAGLVVLDVNLAPRRSLVQGRSMGRPMALPAPPASSDKCEACVHTWRS